LLSMLPTETLCKRLEQGDEEESVERARNILHLMLDELKRSYKNSGKSFTC
jgi:hypothetical protein